MSNLDLVFFPGGPYKERVAPSAYLTFHIFVAHQGNVLEIPFVRTDIFLFSLESDVMLISQLRNNMFCEAWVANKIGRAHV